MINFVRTAYLFAFKERRKITVSYITTFEGRIRINLNVWYIDQDGTQYGTVTAYVMAQYKNVNEKS